MALFETTLVLLTVAVLLLQVARRLQIPYPTILALAGCAVAALPFAPQVTIEPHLALALFVAPAVLDTAFDLPPRELMRNWLPLTSLAILLVMATTGVVAWAGWAMAGMPVAAAIALGAIVAPPDAAAAAAVLRQFELPRRTVVVLQGESLLNDAVALLLFGAAVAPALTPGQSWTSAIPALVLAVPGGVIVGVVMAALLILVSDLVAGTLSLIVVQFAVTFGTWIIADHLHLSAISAVVALAMIISHYLPVRTRPSDRVNATAMWTSVVFVLNVLAFLLMGLQARDILGRLNGDAIWSSIAFGLMVLTLVITIRVLWVLAYGFLLRRYHVQIHRVAPGVFVPSKRVNTLVLWCGTRGLVTLATSLALPATFPSRDLIVLSAFMVVLGTLVVQGLTIRPLIRLLDIPPDETAAAQVGQAKSAMFKAAIATLADTQNDAAVALRGEYEAGLQAAELPAQGSHRTSYDELRLKAVRAQREVLLSLRAHNHIDDDGYHQLERELDWAELHASPAETARMIDA